MKPVDIAYSHNVDMSSLRNFRIYQAILLGDVKSGSIHFALGMSASHMKRLLYE